VKKGYLSEYFEGCVVKQLTTVEADTASSNQHEFNGVLGLRELFGRDKIDQLPTRFLWLGDDQEPLADNGYLTWYDARERHPTRSEYRLYFPTTSVSEKAREGDVLFIAKRAESDYSALVIVCPAGSTVANQLLWLFGLKRDPNDKFVLVNTNIIPRGIDFATRYVLSEIGIEDEEPQDDLIAWIEDFDYQFPTTRVFSQRARESLPNVDPLESADDALLLWMDREEALFKCMEKHIVSSRLLSGFQVKDGSPDVDGFIKFSLSVQNRRKARAGYALENHLEAIFQAHNVLYKREGITENRSKPDFLFPGANEYHNSEYPVDRLTMLGAKSSCKDRWRQVLTEAERIDDKHLLTLEPGISTAQTDEMRANKLQLVLPRAIHGSFRDTQLDWLLSVDEFIEVVKGRQ